MTKWDWYSKIFYCWFFFSYFFFREKITELKTLEWDMLKPDYLISVSNGRTFNFFLKPFFLGSREKSKTRLWLVEFYTNLNIKISILRCVWVTFTFFTSIPPTLFMTWRPGSRSEISIKYLTKYYKENLFLYKSSNLVKII